MRILFASHTSAWSGAEVALLRLIAAVREDHPVAVACPARGPLPAALDRAEIPRFTLPAFEASLRLHPVRTAVGVGRMAAAGAALARAARRFGADIVHANSIRAGLVAAIARGLGAPRFVVRAHEHVPLGVVGRGVRLVLVRTAGAIVAVSDHTARELSAGLSAPVADRVYNSIDHARFDPARVPAAPVRAELGLAPDASLLGQVAQITPWKGQDTAIRALSVLRAGGLDAHLLLIGDVAFAGPDVRYDNHAFRRRLDGLVAGLALDGAVHFLGRRDDVAELLAAVDLMLLPSWDEPFGLATVEAMAMGTPPLVSAVGAGPEIVEDGVTGRVLPPDRPEAWAEAARELLTDADRRSDMSVRARAAAGRFRDEVLAREMLQVHARVLEAPGRTWGAGRWLS